MDAKILEAAAKRPKPESFSPSYGTAGFRAKADLLSSTVFRCGILMAMRALKTNKTTGICITASHNPAPDNGVKLVEPSGEMLLQEYESLADEMAMAESPEKLLEIVKGAIEAENISGDRGNCEVLIAFDTRPSGESLATDAASGVECLGISCRLLGRLTTPQLHWAVMRTNQGMDPSEEAYYELLSNSFAVLVGNGFEKQLHIDCANGVGALKLDKMSAFLEKVGLRVILHNTGDGVLNHECGSDYIQKDKILPSIMMDMRINDFGCAVDGDADRLVYFFRKSSESNGIVLLDGDKIAALVAGLLKELVGNLPEPLSASSIGVVQTAYANGSSTKYLKENVGCHVAITPTGVKHLHKAAHNFDIGIYFEANGHGTVLFKDNFLSALENENCEAAKELLAVSRVINEAVGDAISDILLVEAALNKRRIKSLSEWATLYQDLPSKQLKVQIKDRSVIKTEDAERRVAHPKELQQAIDEAVAKYPGARTFVRPSGTEDVVRIYTEAQSTSDVDELGDVVKNIVIKTLI